AAAVARSHPFQLAYWNELAGGLPGARARGFAQAGDYWGTSYRHGMAWLDRHAAPSAAVAVPLMQHTVEVVAPVRWRADLALLDIARPEVPELRPGTLEILDAVAAERPVYVMFALRDDWTNVLIEHCLRELRPIARWTLDGEPVLVIYRWPNPAGSRVD
ncbi:MAG: hypothetical protein R3190_00460, partial [Thermoanaerobaculia bacterium]|nr:hypothetical protein [Thermoanaerobaculia bacterium]